MNNKINYVDNIGFFRKKSKLTNKQLCELSDISLSTFNDMIRRNNFTTIVLEKLAIVLKVQVSDLVKSDQLPDKDNDLQTDFEKIKEVLSEFEDKHIK